MSAPAPLQLSTFSYRSASEERVIARIVSTGPEGVTAAFLCGGIWLTGRPVPPAALENLADVRAEDSDQLPPYDPAAARAPEPKPEKGLSEAQQAVLKVLADGASTTDVARLLNKPVAACNSPLQALQKAGLVTCETRLEGSKSFLFWLPCPTT